MFPRQELPPATISTEADHRSAQDDANLCEEWHRLKTEEHYSGNQAARALGKSPAWFSINFPIWQRQGQAGLLPKRRELGAARRLFTDLPPWFVPAAKFFYLNTNLNESRGSIPDAIRCTISLPNAPKWPNSTVKERLRKVCIAAGWTPKPDEILPECPENLRDDVLFRQKKGQPLLPESITKQIAVAAPFVRQHRNSKNAGLDFLSAQGTQMWIVNAETGEKMFIRSGDVVECDDATINFPICVPWEIRGCPCSEKFGVKVGRFQWLVAIDAGSRKILGYAYTARPRSSYRAEDILALMRCVTEQHGVPRVWRLEKGAWESDLVINAVEAMGSGRIAVHSPHAKPFIEGLFNTLWTKLSYHFPDASVGRFRAENKEASDLLTACQNGHRDPRKYFPMLADAIAAFEQVIAEYNAHIVRSENYGEWIPNERWQTDTAARLLKRLDPEAGYLFSPFVRTWKVKGNNVGGRVPLFDSLSVPYDFQAPWLMEFHDARVKCHFDPSNPRCFATIVLAEAWGNHRVGEVLGTAPQINETTAYIRLVMGYGDDSPHTGKDVLRQTATGMRRIVRGINGDGGQKFKEDETRDGNGNVLKISSSPAAQGEAASRECGSPTAATARHAPSVFTGVGVNRGEESSEARLTASDELRRQEEELAKLLLT